MPDNVVKLHDNEIVLNGKDYVIAWPDGRMVDTNYLSKHFKKLDKKFNLKDVHFHCLLRRIDGFTTRKKAIN